MKENLDSILSDGIDFLACPACQKPHKRIIDILNHLCYDKSDIHIKWLENNNFNTSDEVSRKQLFQYLNELDLKERSNKVSYP